MKAESLDTSYLARPDGTGPFPGVVVVHEASGLNDNIRDICGRFARDGYAALGVDLFAGRNARRAWRACSPARWPGTCTTTAFRR
jgi:carboxymethylenebutenolidase